MCPKDVPRAFNLHLVHFPLKRPHRPSCRARLPERARRHNCAHHRAICPAPSRFLGWEPLSKLARFFFLTCCGEFNRNRSMAQFRCRRKQYDQLTPRCVQSMSCRGGWAIILYMPSASSYLTSSRFQHSVPATSNIANINSIVPFAMSYATATSVPLVRRFCKSSAGECCPTLKNTYPALCVCAN